MAAKPKAQGTRPLERSFAQGVGPSKRFGGVDPKGDGLEGCHIGGIPVEDLPEDARARLLFQQTDEGIEAANQGKVPSAARVVRTELDGQIAHMEADRLEGAQPWEGADPLRDLAERYTPPGHRVRLLSPKKCSKDGLRGWVPIIVDGQNVKLGDMLLASMPIERAEQRNRFYREQDREQLAAPVNKFNKELERTYREAGGSPPPHPSTRSGSEPDDGLRSYRGNVEDAPGLL